MKVRNRDGEECTISYDEIRNRILSLCSEDELLHLDVDRIVIQTVRGIYDGITTSELDELSASVCAHLQSTHYLYDALAGKILASNLHKNIRRTLSSGERSATSQRFSDKVMFVESRLPGNFHPAFLSFVRAHADALDAMPVYERDYNHNFFSIKTLQRAYLTNIDGKTVETAQDMFLRVSIAIHCTRVNANPDSDDADADAGDMCNLALIRDTYEEMSLGYFTHASPTLFNAGTRFEQLSSCYLVGSTDSLEGIFKTISDCAVISKWAGGIGVHVSSIRAKGARIKSQNGRSDGIIPMLKVYNETARYCNQSGKRKGSIAVYLEPWHADVWDFLELRQNTGAETERARDLFLALWIPDEFMRRVRDDEDWFLMSPDVCAGLNDVYGAEFDAMYLGYVAAGQYTKKLKARQLWQHILKNMLETGTPYICFKDNVNRRSNHANLGTIRSSNLCAEITEYSDSKLYAVCNLASIAVNRFLLPEEHPSSSGPLARIDHARLHAVAKKVTRNLNKIIDVNFYPTPETRASNMVTRPIGIGIQGLGDLYCALGLPYESALAVKLDAEIMETIYHGALEASIELAELHGPYAAYAGSPMSTGQLQFDMGWEGVHHRSLTDVAGCPAWDWTALRARLAESGIRNSLLTALMPTASTSQILGNCECFEPFQANVFKRTTIAGEFMVINKYLMRDLMRMGLWDQSMREALLSSDGSVQAMESLPVSIRDVYKTVWEVSLRSVIDHAAARAPFVDQSQSMNLFQAAPHSTRLSSALFYGWGKGLKTGCYYLRSRPAVEAIKYSILPGMGPATHVQAVKAVTAVATSEEGKEAESEDGAPAMLCSLHDCTSCGA